MNTATLAERFRGFYPVVVDVECGGFDHTQHALLEIAAVMLDWQDGRLVRGSTVSAHVLPFPGAKLDPKALEVIGIPDPYHPLRGALPEREALDAIFEPVRKAQKRYDCQRTILVGHNAAFDLGFLNAAIARTGHKRSPFHPFSTFDTVSLAALAYGQTVLAKALKAAGIDWDTSQAHSAVYDAEQTADLFCTIVNRWGEFSR